MTSIILQRIRQRTQEMLSEAQAGFRADRSAIDQLFTLRRLGETYIEFSNYMYVCYVTSRRRLAIYAELGYGKLCGSWAMKTKL